MDTFWMDLRYAARALARRPGFTLGAVLVLALGIGGGTATFGFVNAVLLRPLPYADPDRLVLITNVIPQFHAEMAGGGDYLDWRDRSRSLEAIAAYSDGGSVTKTGQGDPERIRAARVTASFLTLLGTPPAVGRNLGSDEDRPHGPKSVVVSERLRRRLFPGVGAGGLTSLELDGELHTVVGVLAPGFVFPGQPDVDLLLPLALDEPSERARERQKIVTVLGRLRPGVLVEQARAELKQIQDSANAAAPGAPRDAFVVTGAGSGGAPGSGPESVPFDEALEPTGAAPASPPDAPQEHRMAFEALLKVVPLQQALVADVRPALVLFSVAVGLVLAMTCANLANLLLARAAARRPELAVRSALGAGRGRLVRQLLTESALLSLLGGAAGTLLAGAGIATLLSLMPEGLAAGFRSAAVEIDLRVLAFALVLSLATSMVAGLAPALLASRADAGERMREGAASVSPSARRGGLRRWLVSTEVALAFVLLVGAGLLVRSFHRLTTLDPGFRAEEVVTVALDLDERRAETPAVTRFFETLLERVRALPGVRSAAVGDSLPLRPFSLLRMGLEVEGRPKDPAGRGPELAVSCVSEDYFRTMGITLVRGRAFGPTDRPGAPEVAIVNETLAGKLFGGADPLGGRVRLGAPDAGWTTVVGVAADVRHEGLEAAPRAALYRPFAQEPRGFAFLAVKSAVEPGGLVASLRREVAALDRGLAVHDVATMKKRLADALASRRFNTLLLGAFATSALLLAAVGLYAVMAFAVTERNREMGIRIAIGARPGQVRGLVLRQGFAAALPGIVVGGALALAASSGLRSALFGVAPTDAVTFVVVPLLLLVACGLASDLPARRATRVDPAVTLRAE